MREKNFGVMDFLYQRRLNISGFSTLTYLLRSYPNVFESLKMGGFFGSLNGNRVERIFFSNSLLDVLLL